MTPSDDKLAQLAAVLEARLIDLAKATDGLGRRVMITPRGSGADVLKATSAFYPESFRAKIIELMGKVGDYSIGYRGEEALARNIQLLAAVWEASVRYFDFQRELEK